MSKKIKVILAPDYDQDKILLATMNRYNELCNFISRIIFNYDTTRPINLYYWKVDHNHKNLYYQVRHNFPDINSNMITLAFRMVAKEYTKNKPSEVLTFSGHVDYSTFMISLMFILPAPTNIGMISISTLAGRQKMHFIFDDDQRERLKILFSIKKYGEYKLFYQEEKFYLSRNVSKSKVKEYYRTHQE